MPNLKQLLCYAWNSYKNHKEENSHFIIQREKTKKKKKRGKILNHEY